MMKQNVPELRFKEFEGEWEEKKLGELTETFKSGNSITSKDIFESGTYPVYGGNGLRGFADTFTHDGFHVLIGRQGALCGNINRVKGKTFISEHAIAVKADRNNDTEWLAQKLELLNLNQYSESSAQPGLAVNKLVKFKIPVPSLPEQQKIASFLTAVDARLQLLRQKKALMEEYKKGLMQRIFSQEVRFKKDDGGEFEEWEEKRLGEITFKVDKKNKLGEDLPVYSINNIKGFVPQAEQFEDIDSVNRGYDTSLYKIVEDNTFAYNPARINVGSIGYSGNIGRVIISSLYVCFKTKEEVNDEFFSHFLKSFHFANSVLKMGEGGVRIYLFYENFSQISIQLPSLKEQQKIARFLSAVDEKINLVAAQIAQTEVWKKGLMQGMFV